MDVDEIKAVPCMPLSHPFVERLIGTLRREYLDRTFFWNHRDLERKLAHYQAYYNHHRSVIPPISLAPDELRQPA
jgi:putative transposase